MSDPTHNHPKREGYVAYTVREGPWPFTFAPTREAAIEHLKAAIKCRQVLSDPLADNAITAIPWVSGQDAAIDSTVTEGDLQERAEKAERELAGALQYGQMWEDAAAERNRAEARVEQLERELAEARRDALEQAAVALESVEIDDASRYGSNKWQTCALVRKLCVLKVRSLIDSAMAEEDKPK
jgi:hypothetical protein